jgi:hypothetical protein
MATLEELYRYYLNQPITYVPGSTIGGLSSLTEINRNDAGGDSMEESPVTSINTDPNVTNTTPGTGIMGTNINFSDIGKAIGFAMNPALGIANLAATQFFGKSPMDMAMEAMGIGGFRGPQAGDLSYTDYSDADIGPMGPQAGDLSYTDYSDADIGPMGPQAGDFDGTEGTFSTDTSNTGASSGGVDSAGDGGDGYATGGRVRYAEGGISQEGVIPGFEKIRDTVYFNPDGTPNLEKIKAANFLPGSSINEFGYRDIKTGDTYGQSTYADIASGRYPRIFDPSKYTIGPDNNYYEVDSIITDGGLRYRINADGSRTLLDTTIAQTTPTEDFSDYLNTTTINTNVQTAPTVAEQMISPEDALTPEVPQENPIQKHLDFNEFLKGQGLSQQDYNVLGGYDVAQNLAPGNPILGGAINLASPFYNLMQTFDSAKDAQGNIIKQYVPDMYEDATESGAYYTVPAQKFSDIPGSAARNIQGGLGILTNTQKQQYQDLRNQYETQRQKSAFERFTGAAGPLAENINTAISSLNPFQKQQYMNYAVQNPEQAIAAAQQNKDFLAATQKNIAPPTTPAPASMAAGGRVFYLQGGLASLLR